MYLKDTKSIGCQAYNFKVLDCDTKKKKYYESFISMIQIIQIYGLYSNCIYLNIFYFAYLRLQFLIMTKHDNDSRWLLNLHLKFYFDE